MKMHVGDVMMPGYSLYQLQRKVVILPKSILTAKGRRKCYLL